MTKIEEVRQFCASYPENDVAIKMKEVLREYDEGEMEHTDALLRLYVIRSDAAERSRCKS